MTEFHLWMMIVAGITTVIALVLGVMHWRHRASPKPRVTLRNFTLAMPGAALGLWFLGVIFRAWPTLADLPLAIALLVAIIGNLVVTARYVGGRGSERRPWSYRAGLLEGVFLAVILARGVFLFTVD